MFKILLFYRARPSGVQWRPLWDSMAQECREELTLVEADTLLDTLEAYLQKHRYNYRFYWIAVLQ